MMPCNRQRLLVLLLATSIAVSCAPRGEHAEHAAERVVYTCPMHPEYRSDKPGDCPICGMRLVKASGPASQAAAPSMLTIDAQMQRLIGVKTEAVEVGELSGGIRTTGKVAANEQRLYKVTPRVEGYVETLYADFTGKLVAKGDPLLALYSPELLATEQEYLLALRSRSSLANSGLDDIAATSRDRLHLLGITDAEIALLERSGVASKTLRLHAPVSGYITVKNVTAGAKVSPNDPLFEIVDLSTVWVFADVYENELPRLKLGANASLTLAYWPERAWKGRVSFIAPSVEPATRTVKVRLEIANPTAELKPEMFGNVVIATLQRTGLLVSQDAVIDTGQRKIVFLDLGDGHFQPTEVEVGLSAQGKYEVVRGLVAGDRVALGANFLLDAETRLKGVTAKPLAPAATPAVSHKATHPLGHPASRPAARGTP